MTSFVSKKTHVTIRWGVLLIALTVTAASLLQAADIKHVSAADGGYPWSTVPDINGVSPDINSDYGYALPCPSNAPNCASYKVTIGTTVYGEGDSWGYGMRNCTSYAAWKINQVFGATNIAGWGNAYQWDTGYTSPQTYTVYASSGHTPQVGEIAQWESHPNDTFGHVAYVWNVEQNGTADLMEYNQAYDGNFTSTRTTATGSDGTPDHYIHIGTPPSTDTDGDGVPDTSDNCPTVAGPSWNSGCPVNYQPFAADFNGDGLADIGLRNAADGTFYVRLAPDFNPATQITYQWQAGYHNISWFTLVV